MATKLLRKDYAAQAETLADLRQVRVICSTAQVDRAGEVIVQDGISTANFLATGGTVLFNHNADWPVANAVEIAVVNGKLQATVQFPPESTSAKADEVYNLVKAGVVASTSVGFNPTDAEPMDPKQPRGPQKFNTCELCEFSFVSVPCNPGAVVVERSLKSDEPVWKVGAAKNLPIDETAEWDGPAAADRILADAGFDGDEPDAVKARRGFLVYDSASPDLKGSYELPFADIVGGELKALKSGLDAAASRLPQTDGIPDDVAKKARAVIDHYEAAMTESKAAGALARTKAITGRIKAKGLYDVGRLAFLLGELGWLQDGVQWEADIEGDGSQVPAMLGQVMIDMGNALIAMAAEEVAELVADIANGVIVIDEIDPTEVEFVTSGATPGIRKFRAGIAKMRTAAKIPLAPVEGEKAGKVISATNRGVIQGAIDKHTDAMALHTDALAMHGEAIKSMQGLLEQTDGQGTDEDVPKSLSSEDALRYVLQIRSAPVAA